MQNVQVCYIGIHVPWRFAASIPPSPILGISPNVIPSNPATHCYPSPRPPPLYRPCCVMFPSLCPCVLVVQHSLMSENMQCLVFCSCVSLLRMMVFSFIHVPEKDMNSCLYGCILWSICVIFSLSSLWMMDIWVGSMSLLL